MNNAGLEDLSNLEVAGGFYWEPIGPANLKVDGALDDPDPNRRGNRESQGAGPLSGEVTDIAIDPSGTTDKIIYIATNNGGIWKTTNADEPDPTWHPMSDFMRSLSIGAVALDPSNPEIVYAGTGNLFDPGRFFKKAVGIYKSIDGGETWAIIDGGFFATIFANVGINRIVLPDSNTLLVATESGLFCSVDGGFNFGKNAPVFNDGLPILDGNISSLRLDTNTRSTVYAAVSGEGLFMSTDAGRTFPKKLFAPAGLFTDIAFAQSTQPNKTMYASAQHTLPQGQGKELRTTFVGLFKSIDTGRSWKPVPNSDKLAARDGGKATERSDQRMTIGVDPQNPERIYLGFVQLWCSEDGGKSFPQPACSHSKIHHDHHALVFSPNAHWGTPSGKTQLYAGTDGGIAKSQDGGATWTNLNKGIATNLFYQIDIGRGEGKTDYTYGGMQDTGTAGHRPADGTRPADPDLEWHVSINSDGGPVAVDPANPKFVYGVVNNGFMKSLFRGDSWLVSGNQAFGTGLENPDNDLTRKLALEQSNTNSGTRVVYYSEINKLYRSADAGINFKLINPTNWAKITALATTNLDSKQVWVGLADGKVHYSSDEGQSWDPGEFNVDPREGKVIGAVRGIAVDPTDVLRVAVVYSGFSGINPLYRTHHCYLTSDNGKTWVDISGQDGSGPVGNLPDLPLSSVVWDSSTKVAEKPPSLMVASAAGVLRSTDLGASWQVLGANLPTTSCQSLAIDLNTAVTPHRRRVLRVGTYGRSCFELKQGEGPRLAVRANLGFGAVAKDKTAVLPVQLFNVGDAELVITEFSPIEGSPDFQIVPTPPSRLEIPVGEHRSFTVRFQPSSIGNHKAVFRISSNGPSGEPKLIRASGWSAATPATPRLAVQSRLNFGKVESFTALVLPLPIFNVGMGPLKIDKVSRSDFFLFHSDVDLASPPSFPQTLQPSEKLELMVRFRPTNIFDLLAEFKIESDDPRGTISVEVTGEVRSTAGAILASVLIILGIGGVVAIGVAGAVAAAEEL